MGTGVGIPTPCVIVKYRSVYVRCPRYFYAAVDGTQWALCSRHAQVPTSTSRVHPGPPPTRGIVRQCQGLDADSLTTTKFYSIPCKRNQR